VNIAAYRREDLKAWKDRISFVVLVAGSNLKCPSAPAWTIRNASLVAEKLVEDELRKAYNVNAVVFTGGEPCSQADLPIMAKKAKLRKLAVRVDTNGTRPDVLKTMMERRVVDYVSVGLLAPLRRDAYENACPGSGAFLERVQETVRLLNSSTIDHDFSIAWTPGLSDGEILELGSQLGGARRLVIRQFVPGGCVEPALDKAEKTPYDRLVDVARRVDGPREVRVASEKGEERLR
jgi:pyruvate formate lyase activating enzyme